MLHRRKRDHSSDSTAGRHFVADRFEVHQSEHASSRGEHLGVFLPDVMAVPHLELTNQLLEACRVRGRKLSIIQPRLTQPVRLGVASLRALVILLQRIDSR